MLFIIKKFFHLPLSLVLRSPGQVHLHQSSFFLILAWLISRHSSSKIFRAAIPLCHALGCFKDRKNYLVLLPLAPHFNAMMEVINFRICASPAGKSLGMLRQVLHPWTKQILRNSRFNSTPDQGTQRSPLSFQNYNSVFAITDVVHAEDRKTTSRVNVAVHPHRETQKGHLPKNRERGCCSSMWERGPGTDQQDPRAEWTKAYEEEKAKDNGGLLSVEQEQGRGLQLEANGVMLMDGKKKAELLSSHLLLSSLSRRVIFGLNRVQRTLLRENWSPR